MLHSQLQMRIRVLLDLQWAEIEQVFPGIAGMIDRDVMAARAANDFELSPIIQSDLTRAWDNRLKPARINQLIRRHLIKWIMDLASCSDTFKLRQQR